MFAVKKKGGSPFAWIVLGVLYHGRMGVTQQPFSLFNVVLPRTHQSLFLRWAPRESVVE